MAITRPKTKPPYKGVCVGGTKPPPQTTIEYHQLRQRLSLCGGKSSNRSVRVFKEAHNAVTTLKRLKPLLSKRDKETLSLIIDKELMDTLTTSLQEAELGKCKPLETILD